MKRKTKIKKNTCWNLYWVESDGIEDCFVVAKNSRSARSVEYHMNGFDFEDTRAEKIMPISPKVEKFYKRQKVYKENGWPWYVYGKDFFAELGAEFRTIDGKEQMLLEDVVYSVSDYRPCEIHREYAIGKKAISELREAIETEIEYEDEDAWKKSDINLMAMIGMCLVRCQQIEDYIAHSFLLGISKRQKNKYKTIKELKSGWKKKTFGNMLSCIEEAWEIHPHVKTNFQLFLQMRNRLVHGITVSERYDIRTSWGQRELISFLSLFDLCSLAVKKAFRASCHASMAFALHYWGKSEEMPEINFSDNQEKEMLMFFEFFTAKDDCI